MGSGENNGLTTKDSEGYQRDFRSSLNRRRSREGRDYVSHSRTLVRRLVHSSRTVPSSLVLQEVPSVGRRSGPRRVYGILGRTPSRTGPPWTQNPLGRDPTPPRTDLTSSDGVVVVVPPSSVSKHGSSRRTVSRFTYPTKLLE